MRFTIKSIILWPKDESKEIRNIDFEEGKINIITGGSEKGKSAIIAIIDYCLASESCKIPRKIIRDLTECFGILVSLGNGEELLLARKEPGINKSAGDMYMKFGQKLSIPYRIEYNCNFNDVKHRLNDLAQLPYIDFNIEDSNTGFQSRPSFRDMASFIFQPQYIVANQSSLYYKSDSSAHREKLKTIFPYILKAVDNDYLQLKEELKDKERELSALKKELEKRTKVSEKWLGEIKANYAKALEYGLLDANFSVDEDLEAEKYIPLLKNVVNNINKDSIPLIPLGATTITSERIVELQNQEIEAAFNIQKLRVRQELVKKIEASNRGFRDTLLEQHARLNSLDWFNKKLNEQNFCPFCDSETPQVKNYINQLISVNSEILSKGYKTNDHHIILNDELDKISKELREKENKINVIRTELKSIQSIDEDNSKRIQTINSIYKFVGQLEAELKNYDAQLDNSDLVDLISDLSERISVINDMINQDLIERKIINAKGKVTSSIKHYAKIFNAANHDENIHLNIKDLTLDFIASNGVEEALYEIGSGSNYMAYHLSTLLSLHEFFLQQQNHPVPNFVVFDQPSQAYFPDIDVEFSDKNEDINRVKKIFEVLSDAIARTKGNLQIIILEHVGKYAWQDYQNINLVKRWRDDENDNALIPKDWLS